MGNERQNVSPEALGPLSPFDEHNRRLEAQVHPRDWTNPTPAGRYNLVVIGGGTAGLVTAAGAAGLGAKVALVERDLLGGDCLNVGCVPSKAMIAAARAAAAIDRGAPFGVRAAGATIDFAAAMQRMRRLRADISPADSAARFRELGVDVFFGEARFVDASTVGVGEQRLAFRKAVIASGGRASAPAIDGLEEVEYLTNETVFSLTQLPRRLGVIGAGPIGCELAQAFGRLGAEVVLIEAGHGVLPKEDREAAEIVQRALEREGVKLLCCGTSLRISRDEQGVGLHGDSHGRPFNEQVDRLLVSVGRTPNVEGLNLAAAGVEAAPQGVIVDDRLRTTNRNIFAAGDVCSKYKFTHAADFMARTVIRNALFLGRAKASRLLIPWCTYTSPEVAHVGMYPREAEQQGVAIDTYTVDLTEVDRAVLAGETDGFVRVYTRRGSDRILGATIVAEHAGDMISEITLAMQCKIGLGKLASVIHPYPTQAEAIRKLGDQYNRTRLTPWRKKLLAAWLRWQR